MGENVSQTLKDRIKFLNSVLKRWNALTVSLEQLDLLEVESEEQRKLRKRLKAKKCKKFRGYRM